MSILNNEEFIINVSKKSENDFLHPKDVFNQVLKKMGWFEAQRITYKYFLEKYFRPIPSDKPDIVMNLKNLFPGKIYTFMYNPKYKDELDFYDTRPIILCINTNKNKSTNNLIDFGINFNFLPLEIKNLMINKLWNTYNKVFQYNIKKIKKKQIMQQKPLFIDSYDYMELLDTLWEYTMKTNYRFALRSYIYKNMSFIKEIYYEDWGLISFINSKDVIGIETGEIFRKYWAIKLSQDRQLPKGPKRDKNRKKIR